MVIWSRWGILTFFAAAFGVLAGFGVAKAINLPTTNLLGFALMLAFAAVFNLALTLWFYPLVDKPKPAVQTRKLIPPVRDAQGRVQLEERIPVLDANGNQKMVTQHSTLFYIPARFYWIIFAVLAVIVAIVSLFR